MLAVIYATQIIKGNWTYDRVPNDYKEDVRLLIISEGREDLINAQ
ncbi:CD1375 family protein [Oceanobacillus jordanicus]|nr:CD1375 family protein [Oceanobacillus jordanicus]